MSPECFPLAERGFLQEVFDAIPAMVLIVDADLRIQMLNRTAVTELGLDLDQVRFRRTGDVLHCIRAAASEEGCGRHAFCQDCVIRNSVILALQGCRTTRRGLGMVLVAGEARRDIHLLVSASPLRWREESFVVLTLENVSDLLRLRNLLPICMHCHKIRDDEGGWHPLADYFKRQLDVDFSHGICPDCKDTFYSSPRAGGA